MFSLFKEVDPFKQNELELQVSKAALMLPTKLNKEEQEGLKILLDAVRQQPEVPIVKHFAGCTWHISRDKIEII